MALGFLVASGVAAGQSLADSLLDRAARNVAASRPMRAKFVQTVTNPELKQSKTSTGEFAQQGAAKFAMRFSDPPSDAIIADGATVWVYLPSASRGQALKLPLTQGAQLDLFAQLLTAPRASYKITEGGVAVIDGQSVVVLRLVPTLQTAPFARATLWLDRISAEVRQLEVVELSGLVRRIRFLDLRSDVEIPANLFTFVAPQGVKVIDAAGLLGGRATVPPRR